MRRSTTASSTARSARPSSPFEGERIPGEMCAATGRACVIVVRNPPERPMPAKRAYGMDQDFYPWSPIVKRPVLRWPGDAGVALAVIVNLEHWDWEVPPGTPVAVSPMGGPEGLWSGNQPQFPDIGGWGNHEYGNRVGVFRILGVLDKYGIVPTLALDKAGAEH